MIDNTPSLKELFDGPETDLFERKRTYDTEKVGVGRTICAFANDLSEQNKVGTIFIGQGDNLECAGLTESEIKKLLERIPSLRDSLSPQVSFQITKEVVRNCPLVVIRVPPATMPPVRYQRDIYIRIGSATKEASAEDEHILVEKQSRNLHNAQFFDQQPTVLPCTLNELDMFFIEREYIPAAVSAETLAQNSRTLEMRLSSLRMLTADGAPNNAAVLCFHPEPRRYLPGCYIQFLRIDGPDLTSPVIDNQEFNGPVYHQLRQAKEKLQANIAIGLRVGGGRESHELDYPFEAIYQALCNAVMHRDYKSTSAPAKCYWFSDRIEIQSPGGLYGIVKPQNLESGSVTDYRNSVVAEALKTLGWVEKFGAGISIIKRTMSYNGNPPPIFEPDDNYVLVTLPIKRR